MKLSKRKTVLGVVTMLLIGGLGYQNCGSMNESSVNLEQNSVTTQVAMLERSNPTANKPPVLDALILKNGSRIAVQDSKKINGEIVLTLMDGTLVKMQRRK